MDTQAFVPPHVPSAPHAHSQAMRAGSIQSGEAIDLAAPVASVDRRHPDSVAPVAARAVTTPRRVGWPRVSRARIDRRAGQYSQGSPGGRVL